jgi:hypothetical protein
MEYGNLPTSKRYGLKKPRKLVVGQFAVMRVTRQLDYFRVARHSGRDMLGAARQFPRRAKNSYCIDSFCFVHPRVYTTILTRRLA